MSDKDIIKDAKEAFEETQEAESKNREAWVSDVRFARLGEQWPAAVKRQRELDGRPCLTLNRLPAFIRQVTNDARQNRPAINCHPVGGGANQETAEILNGLVRNIEYSSNAEVAYDTALEHAVTGGFGYFRINTAYSHDDTFDQDLIIERIANPLSVYGDHRCTDADSANWNQAFITQMYSDAEFKAKFGKDAKPADWQADSHDKHAHWMEENATRVAEYWTRDDVQAKILKLSDGSVVREESFLKVKDLLTQIGIQVVGDRPIMAKRVTQRIMTGAEILETNKWAGQYIPIVPVYGDEVILEGERSLVSLVRFAKDSQMMLNFWRTASTELVALAPKAPFIGPRGFANSSPDKWNTANTVNHSYLEYDGPTAPQRQAFDGPPAGALQEALNAQDDMKSIMGIFDASLGARSNETSGRAIMARQREGDVSTFNFIDNLSRAIRHAGRILVDMIPHVYNTERIIRVIHEDGENEQVTVNGQQQPNPDAMEDAQGMLKVYDLTAGKYDVTCEAGPSFTTQREEAAAQMMQFIQSYPNAGPVIGDLLAKNLDWPGADDIADRLKALLPPAAQGVNPQLQQLQQQLQQMDQQAHQAVGQLQQELQQMKADKAIEAEKLRLEGFKAETDRMKVIGELQQASLAAAAEAQRDLMTQPGMPQPQQAQPNPA